MISPHDMKQTVVDPIVAAETLERLCYDALLDSNAHSRWPAQVKRPRMRIDRQALVECAIKYRGLGWRVTVGDPGDGWLMAIDHPPPVSDTVTDEQISRLRSRIVDRREHSLAQAASLAEQQRICEFVLGDPNLGCHGAVTRVEARDLCTRWISRGD